jgi:hypothetical protein
MMAHAKLSPSSAHRWTRCPGSVREELKYPDNSGPAALDGTRTHALLEMCLAMLEMRLLTGMDPELMVGMTTSDDEGSYTIDADRAKRVKVAVDHVRDLGGEVTTERRVDPSRLVGRDDLGGTVDVTVIVGDTAHVIDYKDGITPVEAVENEQLIAYALGHLAGYNLPINGDYPVKHMVLTIIQPKLALKGLPPITSWELSVESLLSRIGDIVVKASATDAPDAPLVPGEKQCRFCKAKGGCAAVNTHVMDAVGMFKSIDIVQQAAVTEPTEMSNDKLREVIEAAPLLRQLLEASEAEALRRMQMGQTIPGLKVVNGRGSRAWAHTEDEMVVKLKKIGIPAGALYVTKLISPAQAEKLTWEKRDGTKVQVSDKMKLQMERELIVKLAGKPTVASESDPRPAVVTDASNLFGAVGGAVETLPSFLS